MKYRCERGLFVGVFAEFHECAAGRFGVKECDVETFGALAGCFVDEAAAFFFGFGESVGHAVLHGECDVLYAAAAAVVGDEFGDGTVVGGAFEELDFGLAYFKEGGAYFLVGHFFNGEAFETEDVFVERDCLVERGDGYADMFDVRNVHDKYEYLRFINGLRPRAMAQVRHAPANKVQI